MSLKEDEDVLACEDALISAFCALAMRLSEKNFRPIMFRLTQWTEEGLVVKAQLHVRLRIVVAMRVCKR
jgi:hypothetical protein